MGFFMDTISAYERFIEVLSSIIYKEICVSSLSSDNQEMSNSFANIESNEDLKKD